MAAPLFEPFGWFNAVVLAVLFDDDKCPFPLSQWRGLFSCCFARRPKPNIGINCCCRVVNRRYDLWNLQWHTITYELREKKEKKNKIKYAKVKQPNENHVTIKEVIILFCNISRPSMRHQRKSLQSWEREKKNSSLNLFANVIFFYLVISSSSSGVFASRYVFFPLVWITVISAPNWSDQQNQHNPLNLFGFEFKTKCTRMRVHDFHTRNPETLRRTNDISRIRNRD